LLAGMPIFVLLGLLLAGTSAIRAAAAGLAAAVVISIVLFKMPVSAATAAAAYGACLFFIHDFFWTEGKPCGGEVGHAAESDPQWLRSRWRLGGTVIVATELR